MGTIQTWLPCSATHISSGGWWNIRCAPHCVRRISPPSVVWLCPSQSISNLILVFLAKKKYQRYLIDTFFQKYQR